MALRSDDNTNRPTRRSRLAKVALTGVAFAGLAGLGACVPDVPVIEQVFGPQAAQATAIAKCESNLNPLAVSRTNDHGLFQINAVHKANFAAVTGQPWSSIYNPYWNAVYAKRMVDTQGWAPWSCSYVLAK